jgi:hypothetical protein
VNGKHGDHPITDILVHALPVYSPAIDALVREVAGLGGEPLIADLLLSKYSPWGNPDLAKLDAELRPIRDRLAAEAKGRGWEPLP